LIKSKFENISVVHMYNANIFSPFINYKYEGKIIMFESPLENAKLMNREMDYNINLIISKKLLECGLINQEEYDEIDTILQQRYAPSLSIFISENA